MTIPQVLVILSGWLVAGVWITIGLRCRAAWRRERARADIADMRAEDSRQMAERRDRNAWEFFGIIQGIERERDTWKNSYFDAMAGAANAQEWLFRELNRVHQIANQLATAAGKKPVAIDPALTAIAEAKSDSPKIERAPGIKDALEARRRQLDELGEEPAPTTTV